MDIHDNVVSKSENSGGCCRDLKPTPFEWCLISALAEREDGARFCLSTCYLADIQYTTFINDNFQISEILQDEYHLSKTMYI